MLFKALLSMFDTFYVTKCRCDTMSEHRQFIIENDDFQNESHRCIFIFISLETIGMESSFLAGMSRNNLWN